MTEDVDIDTFKDEIYCINLNQQKKVIDIFNVLKIDSRVNQNIKSVDIKIKVYYEE